MKQILKKILFGDDADFFLHGNYPIIILVETLDRERSTVEVTFEVENTNELPKLSKRFSRRNA